MKLARQSFSQISEEQNPLVQSVCRDVEIPIEECSTNSRMRHVSRAARAEGKEQARKEGGNFGDVFAWCLSVAI